MSNYVARNQYLDCPVNEQNQGTLCLGTYDATVPWIRRWTMDNYFCGRSPTEFGVCGSFWYFLRGSYEELAVVPDAQLIQHLKQAQTQQHWFPSLRSDRPERAVVKRSSESVKPGHKRSVATAYGIEHQWSSIDEFVTTTAFEKAHHESPHIQGSSKSKHHHSHLKKHGHHHQDSDEEVTDRSKRGISHGAPPVDFFYELQLGVEWMHRVCACHCGCTMGCYDDMPLNVASVSVCGIGKTIYNNLDFNISQVTSGSYPPPFTGSC